MTDKKTDFDTEKNKILGGTLYLVATPIGNLADLSERQIKVLSEVDFIAAEDTRNSAKLLSRLDISKEMVSYFEHNKRERGEEITKRILSGESCALITDAGTPAISDPGEDLVVLCSELNIPVTGVPGPCAAINALMLSGLPTGRFAFEGFLSVNKNERRERLEEIRRDRRTLIFHEAPHKLKTTLDDLLGAFGNRRISLCREMTKLNEEIMRTTLSDAIKYYSENQPRGEYVLVIEGYTANDEKRFFDNMSIDEHIEYYIKNFSMTKMDAVKAVAKDRGVPKNQIYNQYVKSE